MAVAIEIAHSCRFQRPWRKNTVSSQAERGNAADPVQVIDQRGPESTHGVV
ncbi:MAG: hypothetical protein GY788_15330 [bacterium]|nr:hypothetical protein [bacterium]